MPINVLLVLLLRRMFAFSSCSVHFNIKVNNIQQLKVLFGATALISILSFITE